MRERGRSNKNDGFKMTVATRRRILVDPFDEIYLLTENIRLTIHGREDLSRHGIQQQHLHASSALAVGVDDAVEIGLDGSDAIKWRHEVRHDSFDLSGLFLFDLAATVTCPHGDPVHFESRRLFVDSGVTLRRQLITLKRHLRS